MISVLLTTQKYVKLPTIIRSNINILIAFNLMKMDWSKIEEEIIYSDKDVFYNVLNFVFSNDDDSSNFLMYNVDKNTFYKKFDKITL